MALAIGFRGVGSLDRRRFVRALLAVTIAVFVASPAWIVPYLPMQDLPFHVAAVRVIHSFHNERYGIDSIFQLRLASTQYVLYYLIGDLLAYVLGVFGATKALVALYFGGTFLALRSFVLALGKDGRLALFVVPLLMNVLVLYGFMPFLLGFPLMFASLAVATRYLRAPSLGRGALLAGLSLALFYMHVLPFFLFGVGFAAMFPWLHPRKWLNAGAPTVPALAAVVWWTFFSAAAEKSRTALHDGFRDPATAVKVAFEGFHANTTRVFQDSSDDHWVFALGILVLLSFGLSQGDREDAAMFARRWVVVPLVCVLAFVFLGDWFGDVWLFGQRFGIPGMMCAIPLLRMPRGARGWVLTACLLFVGAGATLNTCKHFIAFQAEVGDFDVALSQMNSRSRVCALIYDANSTVVHNSPFLHFGSYYQARKGGMVMFTFAGWPHWPFEFRPDALPPQGPRARKDWEWQARSIDAKKEIYPYYDYVLTRGGGFSPEKGTYHVKWRGAQWAVWVRDATEIE